MTDNDKHDDLVITEFSPTLGQRLREEREAKGMNIPEVATQLRLTKDMVKSLENDQWDDMHGRIYARGYFVSYVKFLELPYAEMMGIFDAEYSVKEPDLKLNQHNQSTAERSIPWLLIISIVIVLAIVFLAYQQWQKNEPISVPETTEQGGEAPQENDVESESSQENMDISPEPESIAEPTEVTSPISSTETETTASEQNLSLNEPQVEASSVLIPLQVQFLDDCWVELRNGDNGLLIKKSMHKGETLEFESEQPFTLLLGKADAATVTYNNESVDLAPYTEGDVAKMTLGVES